MKGKAKKLVPVAGLVIAFLLFVPFSVGASSQPQPLPAGINCTEAAEQVAAFHLYVGGALSNFSMTLQAEKGNLTYDMRGLSYDSSIGYFRIDSMHVRIANTSTNKLLAEGFAKDVLLDTHSNSTYVVFQFNISVLTWKADAKFMQKIYSEFPLTSLSLTDFTLKVGIDCSSNTYVVGGSQQTNAVAMLARYLR